MTLAETVYSDKMHKHAKVVQLVKLNKLVKFIQLVKIVKLEWKSSSGRNTQFS